MEIRAPQSGREACRREGGPGPNGGTVLARSCRRVQTDAALQRSLCIRRPAAVFGAAENGLPPARTGPWRGALPARHSGRKRSGEAELFLREKEKNLPAKPAGCSALVGEKQTRRFCSVFLLPAEDAAPPGMKLPLGEKGSPFSAFSCFGPPRPFSRKRPGQARGCSARLPCCWCGERKDRHLQGFEQTAPFGNFPKGAVLLVGETTGYAGGGAAQKSFRFKYRAKRVTNIATCRAATA